MDRYWKFFLKAGELHLRKIRKYGCTEVRDAVRKISAVDTGFNAGCFCVSDGL
jgi:hypothetical protein